MYLTIALGSFVQESYPGLMNLTAVAGIPPTWLWVIVLLIYCWFFSSRRRHTRLVSDWVQTCALPIRSEEHTSELQSLTNLVCRLIRSEEHTSELQSLTNLVCRLLLEKKQRGLAHGGQLPRRGPPQRRDASPQEGRALRVPLGQERPHPLRGHPPLGGGAPAPGRARGLRQAGRQ